MTDQLKGLAKLPEDIRARIAKRSRDKGSNYERDVAKKIASYFGKKWDECFYRTKPHGHAQPNGDIQPINEMNDLWRAAKLGPLECKNRMSWSFDQLFKYPERSELYRFWVKSNEDTGKDNTILVFTKNGVGDYVMTSLRLQIENPATLLIFGVPPVQFQITTLQTFLNTIWPRQ